MRRIAGRHWLFALVLAVSAHGAVAAALFSGVRPEPAQRMPGQAVAISLGAAGGKPGAAAASPTSDTAEAVQSQHVQRDVVEVNEPATAVETATVKTEADVEAAVESATEQAKAEPATQVAVDVAPDQLAISPDAVEVAASEPTQQATMARAQPLSPPPPRIKPVRSPSPDAAASMQPPKELPTIQQLQVAAIEEQVAQRLPSATAPAADTTADPMAAVTASLGAQGPGASSATDAVGGDGGNPGQRSDFFTAVQAWLEQHKRYPRGARLRNQSGVVLMRFVLLQDGRVDEYEVVESSGYAALDTAAAKMIERAQPMPKIPAPLGQSRIELVVPIAYQIR